MDKKILKRNILASVVLQIVTIAYGFVIPRLILTYFGSEMNGLASSITQFLNYIQLMEGGLSGVIMAALYKPLADSDIKKVSSVLLAAENFFRHIALIYIVYAVGVAFLYPLINNTTMSFSYVFSLTLILAAGTFIQYFFSISYRLLINADQQGYVVSYAYIFLYVFNLVAAFLVLKIYPDFRIMKMASVVAFATQPIIYSIYVKKKYKLDLKNAIPDKDALSQRWDGFGQNLAYFIHTNTDIVLLTFFATLLDVSIYSVYFMIVEALKGLVRSVTTAISPSFGNALASKSREECNSIFEKYELLTGIIATFTFTCCSILIVPFVTVYTAVVNDANYIQPVFAVILSAAEYVYCVREPFVNVAYNSGHFKQTAAFAYIEAGMNIIVSLILIKRLGIVGVAIGTLLSMSTRAVLHVVYIKKQILFRPIRLCLKNLASYLIPAIASFVINKLIPIISVNNYFDWFLYAVVVAAGTFVLIICSQMIFNRSMIILTVKGFLHRTREVNNGEKN